MKGNLQSIVEEDDEIGMPLEFDVEKGIANHDSSSTISDTYNKDEKSSSTHDISNNDKNDSNSTLSDVDTSEKSPIYHLHQSCKTSRNKYEEKTYAELDEVKEDHNLDPDVLSDDDNLSDKVRRRSRGVTFSREESLSERSFLQDLEKKENKYDENQGRVRTNSTMDFALHGHNDSSAKQYGRERNNTVQRGSETTEGRDRSGTMGQGRERSGTEIKGRERSATEFLNISVFDDIKRISFREIIYNQIMVVVDFLMTSDLSRRPQLYLVFFLFISLMLVADASRSAAAWYRFCGAVIIVDMVTAVLDHLFFVFVVDKVFSKQYNVAYMMKGLHGPLGLLATLLIVSSSLNRMLELKENFAEWRNYVSAMITVLVFVCIKNWFIRKHYTKLLNDKFSDRVFQLQTWRILLSELATTKPPKVKNSVHSKKIISSFRLNKEDLLRHSVLPAVIAPVSIASNKIRNVFAAVVTSSSSKYNEKNSEINTEDFSEKRDRSDSSANSSTDKRKEKDKSREAGRRRKTFWESAAKLSRNAGVLHLTTYNGEVIIRKQAEAIDFGSLLYAHLSREGRKAVTWTLLEKLFNERPDKHYDTTDFTVLEQHAKSDEKASAMVLYEAAIKLLDPISSEIITEDQCVDALCEVYKETRFAASSLNEYGELHSSLRLVIDIIFWILMTVILQVFIQIDLVSYFLPFVTIALAASFAVAGLVGQVSISIAYVFFMMPYETGNKIAIGPPTAPQLIGWVRAISLMYTTICTYRNEVIRIPNHTLFQQMITNYSEPPGAVYQLEMVFNISGNDKSLQPAIDNFLDKVRHYCVVEEKNDWAGVFIMCKDMDIKTNSISYLIMPTHRDNVQDNGRSLLARTRLWQYMTDLQHRMGIVYIPTRQPHLVYMGKEE
mmetsp:Transcript_8346/g.8320  ORF Transcript_8346/g.8320 Transcript_8346/m.8320 type:complete len:893 (+) Transcript_8346:234-2912(+)|eukprot:CAMPEP_0119053362 /NCGR_PEP_ID=MMETSP1177-20130426/74383_1 /TAXON_ID=2985 /ORGANISM="Ochromonas sp, Strain CCMP1899" /LENGTH=892 /DNA_ID=CAMNT_0007033301 /DNA_START=141 /DNA_END=2819 /DNA_ORIENTATION=-